DGRAAAGYLSGPPRLVPGFESLHKMASMLLGERVPEGGRVLVLGAGGGLEMKALGEAHPNWGFDGVDPSAEMLALAREVVGPDEARFGLHHGYIGDAPGGPYDAAICLLTFHFIA